MICQLWHVGRLRVTEYQEKYDELSDSWPEIFRSAKERLLFFNLATLLNGLLRLGQFFDKFYFDFILSFFLFCHLKDKFDHFFTSLVIHLATLRTNLGIIELDHFFPLG